MIPNRLMLRSYWGRSGRLWLIARVAISAVFVLAGDNPLQLSLLAIIAIALLTTALGFVDLRRNREQSLLGNLGLSRAVVAGLVCVPPIIGEGLLLIAGRVL